MLFHSDNVGASFLGPEPCPRAMEHRHAENGSAEDFVQAEA